MKSAIQIEKRLFYEKQGEGLGEYFLDSFRGSGNFSNPRNFRSITPHSFCVG